MAIVAWLASIPILSGIVAVGGGFMAVLTVVTIVHEMRVRLARDRAG